MKREEIDKRVEEATVKAFVADGIPADTNRAEVAAPFRSVGDDTFDCSGGFDERYNWTNSQVREEYRRNIVRADINSIGAVGVTETAKAVIGQTALFSEDVAKSDTGYYGGAEVRDPDTARVYLPNYAAEALDKRGYVAEPTEHYFENNFKRENSWFVEKPMDVAFGAVYGSDYSVDGAMDAFDVTWTANDKLPSRANITAVAAASTTSSFLSGGTKVANSVVFQNTDTNGMPKIDGNYSAEWYNYYANYNIAGDCEKAKKIAQEWVKSNTANGDFLICTFTPKRDVYGSILPSLLVGTADPLFPLGSVTGIIGTTFPAQVVQTGGNKAQGFTANVATGFYKAFVPWGYRWWVAAESDDLLEGDSYADRGVTLLSARFNLGKSGDYDIVEKKTNNRVPILYFRKAVEYRLYVTLENAMLVAPPEGQSGIDFLNRTMTPLFPITPDTGLASIQRAFLAAARRAQSVLLMEYGDAHIPAAPAYPYYPEKTYEDPFA